MMEAQILLAMTARRFELERARWHRVRFDASVTLRPKDGLPAVRRARATPATSTAVAGAAYPLPAP